MTTKTKTTADQSAAEELAAVTETVEADLKQKEDDDRRKQVEYETNRRLAERRRAERKEQPNYWPPRLARHGMTMVTAAPGWEQCPVPETSASSVDFNNRPTDHGRPVAYCASVWTLDDRGVHRGAGYWICSPVFQIQRGVNGAADRFALLVDGAWQLVDGPPIPTHGSPEPNAAEMLLNETMQRLTAAGLALNSQPLEVVYDRVPVSTFDYQPAQIAALRNSGHISGSTAARQLTQFLDAHKTEAPIREGNRR